MGLRWIETCLFCGHSAHLVAQANLRAVDVDCPHCGFLRVPDAVFQDLDSTYAPAVLLAIGEHLNGIGRLYDQRLVLTSEKLGEIVSSARPRNTSRKQGSTSRRGAS